MHLNIKPYLIILASVILILILFGCLRNFVFERQFGEWDQKNEFLIKVVEFAAFMIFGAAAVPVFLKIFLTLQIKAGNGELPLVKLLRQYPMKLMYTVWTVLGGDLSICREKRLLLPVMRAFVFLETDCQRYRREVFLQNYIQGISTRQEIWW